MLRETAQARVPCLAVMAVLSQVRGGGAAMNALSGIAVLLWIASLVVALLVPLVKWLIWEGWI